MSSKPWRKIVAIPEPSVQLSEFVGIMIGDGTISKYQIGITLNLTMDLDYSYYVAALIFNLFGISATRIIRKKSGCSVLVVSSVALTEYLVSIGLPQGDKMKAKIDIPEWIMTNGEFFRACIRGIFDTDGSIFQEIHHYKTTSYAYSRVTFTSYSLPLRKSLARLLNDMNIHTIDRGNRNVCVERFTDIEKYFKIVGSSNPKHLARYAQFGGVG